MPVSVKSDTADVPGQPTLWSATVDALAVGAEIVRNGEELELLSAPDPERARLLVVSAGNTDESVADHLVQSDLSAVLDPGQAWNALTIGAHTELTEPPTDPAYTGWDVVAEDGELSPYSRTSLLFGLKPWPIKPDVVMEGGNVLHDGGSLFEPGLPVLSTRTTGHVNDQALTSAHATSAATAQGARLAALAMATYPEYWPETICALVVHGAEWTPVMRAAVTKAGKPGKRDQQAMLRRYGWGVPTEDRVLFSTDQAVTLVVQDEFIPFEGDEFKIRAFRLHDLPWPTQVLQDLGDAQVDLRITLSYLLSPLRRVADGAVATPTPHTTCASRFKIPWKPNRSSYSVLITMLVQRRPADAPAAGRSSGSWAPTSATSVHYTRISGRPRVSSLRSRGSSPSSRSVAGGSTTLPRPESTSRFGTHS